ncbi:MAG TPA: trehalose-6-phosphate synthase [Gemmatimonadaceae bacterium]|nr:trehalose-6-phosphate synthase [Gemmatimonadaceae bacterium]
MSRLITVSNRLPLTVSVDGDRVAIKPSAGGLATGLRRVIQGDDSLWIGWTGDPSGAAVHLQGLHAQLAALNAKAISLTPKEIEIFYEQISNAVLWPLCHDRIDQLPLRVDGWETYEAVNQRYADAVIEAWRPGDDIWVHDYQLLRVPRLVRERIPEARIGFFLHVPFPNPEIFFTLPVRRWLVDGMLGADLIGFHTRRYRGHFTAAMRRLFGIEMDQATATIRYNERRVSLGIFPMGVDAAEFAARASDRAVSVRTLELKQPGVRLLVGIDRLDYSKGIQRRLLALERLLTVHPEWRERVRLIQVAVPSRGRVGAYRRFRTEVESLVGRINGEFATPSWSPIHYLFRSVPMTTLVALYRAADVMLVTPVRDGMNLVAKEFVACRADEDGVLILSEFAGAADELTDAFIVNPYDVDGVAEMIHDALSLPGAERRSRMRQLRDRVFGHDIHVWVSDFLAALDAAVP